MRSIEMLTKEEFHYNFKALKFNTFLSIFPLKIDEETGKIRRQVKKWKRIVWMFQFGFSILYLCHLTVGLGQALIYPKLYFTPHHFILHCILLIESLLLSQWQYSAFISRPDNFLAIFNQCFEAGSGSIIGRRSFTAYSFQDLFTFIVPFMVYIAEVLITFLYILDSSRVQLLHFRFPSQYKNPVTLIFLLIPDILHLTFLCGTSCILFTHQVLFFEKCHLILQSVQKEIR